MTHDPLCPNRKVMADFPSEIECGSCTFIAKVRADESKRKDDEIYEWRIKASDQYGHGFHEGWKRGRESALNQAREAVSRSMTHDRASNSTDNSTDNSTHDPLCTFPDYPYSICWVCKLIAKVRADERARQDRDALNEIRFEGLRMAMSNFDPCPNCAESPCECKPAPCCGVPWNPRDFTSGKDCWWCQRSTQEMSA